MKIICTKCGKEFDNDGDLVRLLATELPDGSEECKVYNPTEEFDEGGSQEVINGCPVCMTDSYLLDVEGDKNE